MKIADVGACYISILMNAKTNPESALEAISSVICEISERASKTTHTLTTVVEILKTCVVTCPATYDSIGDWLSRKSRDHYPIYAQFPQFEEHWGKCVESLIRKKYYTDAAIIITLFPKLMTEFGNQVAQLNMSDKYYFQPSRLDTLRAFYKILPADIAVQMKVSDFAPDDIKQIIAGLTSTDKYEKLKRENEELRAQLNRILNVTDI